jgi:hypothetical protein
MECRCFLCCLYLREIHWDLPSGRVKKVSSEEIGNKQIEEQGRIIDIISIFSCCDCNHIVVERRIIGMKEIDHFFL